MFKSLKSGLAKVFANQKIDQNEDLKFETWKKTIIPKSLGQKKYRQKHKLFVAEGIKVVREFLQSSFELHSLFTTNNAFQAIPSNKVFQISSADLHKISSLKTPNKVLALFHIPEEVDYSNSDLYVALDSVNDPGNLGTIIRLCDWFGIEHLLCSKETVDCFNSKVVQASMGSLTRVSIHYVDLIPAFQKFMLIAFNGYYSFFQNNDQNLLNVQFNNINTIFKKIVFH